MKTKLILIFILLINLSFAQSWMALGGGVNGTVNCMVADTVNNVMYVGGEFTTAGGITVNGVAKWNGNSWSALGNGLIGPGTGISSLAIYRGELYAGGNFDVVSGTSFKRIAKWNGTVWTQVGGGVTGGANVLSLAEYKGELYVGGDFTHAGNSSINTPGLARWDGTSWLAVNGSSTSVLELKVLNGDLYAGGYFSQVGTITANKIAKWNGTTWTSLGSGLPNNSWVGSIELYKGEIYAGGLIDITSFTITDRIAKWNGTSWSWMNVDTMFAGGNVDLFVYQNELYAGGNIPSGKTGNIMKWNGTGWTGINANITGSNRGIKSFAELNGALYIAGTFTGIGGTNASNIVKYSPVSGVAEGNKSLPVTLFPNPVKDMLSIHFEKPITSDVVISIYDVYGKEVDVIPAYVTGNSISIEVGDYTKGIYFIGLSCKESKIIKKVIVQ